jgi:hypothetical protein
LPGNISRAISKVSVTCAATVWKAWRFSRFELGVEEADVERGVVDDHLGAGQKAQQVVGHLGELGLVGQKFIGQAVDAGGLLAALALGVEVDMAGLAGEPAVDHLDAADLDDAVAALGAQAGGFGVEEDLSHRGVPCSGASVGARSAQPV